MGDHTVAYAPGGPRSVVADAPADATKRVPPLEFTPWLAHLEGHAPSWPTPLLEGHAPSWPTPLRTRQSASLHWRSHRCLRTWRASVLASRITRSACWP